MSIQGNLNTMKLTDLLRWVAEQGETGVLELERNKVCKRIAFSAGQITGCSSDDPPARIGQFLLARGKISREALAQALDSQSETGNNLGAILIEMGEIDADELAHELASKAEENILSLFDWREAVFRFEHGEAQDPWMIAVELSVAGIIERGLERHEQLETIRQVFASSGVVLERADVRPPEPVMANPLARGILGTIDGARTIADVLYHTHASEFLVLKFLASAVRAGFAEIVAVRDVDMPNATLLDVERASAPAVEVEPDKDPELPSGTMVPGPESTFEERLELSQHFLAQNEIEAALDVLDECYEERPGDEFLGHLIEKAETAFILGCRESDLKSNHIPAQVPGRTVESCEGRFSAAERFLLGMMTEGHTLQTLLWVAPMREVDVYRALARMKKAGLIELHDVGDVDLVGTEAPAIEWA